MILADHEIRDLIAQGTISLSPYTPENLKQCSYSFTLDTCVHRYPNIEFVDAHAPQPDFQKIILPKSGYLIEPGAFILGKTVEHVTLPAHIACILGTRGSIAQLGLNVLQSSIIAEPGTSNTFVLEIKNQNTLPVKIYPGIKIVKGIFIKLSTDSHTRNTDSVLFNT